MSIHETHREEQQFASEVDDFLEALFGDERADDALGAQRSVADQLRESSREKACYGQLESALALAHRAVELHEQNLNLNALEGEDLFALKSYGDARDQRAWVYGRMGELETGLRELRATLKIRRRSAERDHAFISSVAHTLMICASLHQKQSHHDNALVCAQEALVIRRELAARGDRWWPCVAQSLSSMARSLHKLGAHEQACEAALESLQIMWSLAEADQQYVWVALDTLRAAGLALWRCGRTEEAIVHQRYAVTIYEALLRDTVVDVRRALAVVYADLSAFFLNTDLEESIRYGTLCTEQRRLALDGTSQREFQLALALMQLALRYDRRLGSGDARLCYEEAVRMLCVQSLIDPTKRSDLVRCHRHFASSALQEGDFETATAQCERALELASAIMNDAPDEDDRVALLASVLRTHGYVLFEAGFGKQALAQTRLAVELMRPLGQRHARFVPSLGSALESLRLRLDGNGNFDEALLVAVEEEGLWSEIVAAGDISFLPNLASARSGLALAHSRFGRRLEAIAMMSESVVIQRARLVANPAAAKDLAVSLGNLAVWLDDFEALDAAKEAVRMYRPFAKMIPSRRTLLASMLNNLSNRLMNAGRYEEALTAASECVDLYRETNRNTPPDRNRLAMGIGGAALKLAKMDRYEEAVEMIRESIAIREELAQRNPVFRSGLGLTLNNCCHWLTKLNRGSEAVIVGRRAVEILAGEVTANPGKWTALYAGSRSSLAGALAASGAFDEALTQQRLAISLLEPLVRADAPPHEVLFAEQFVDLGKRLADVGQGSLGLVPTEHAVMILRARTKTQPGAYLRDLAYGLSALGDRQHDCGNSDQAEKAWGEAAAIRRCL
jgi:tetratricopeptide (TPR) repeat protein